MSKIDLTTLDDGIVTEQAQNSYAHILSEETILDLKHEAKNLYDACLLRYYGSTNFDRYYYMKKIITAANEIVSIMENNNE